MFLEDSKGKVYRLSFGEREAETASDKRTLPAGDYVWTGYRVVKEDAEGKPWTLSVTSPEIRKIKLKAGKEVQLEVDPSIRFHGRVSRQGDHFQLGMVIQGMDGAGLSIYREGRRIPIPFQLLDAQGAVVDSGKMRYG